MSAAKSAARKMLIPLALAQFVASFAGTNMNVAINSIATDLGISVHAVQTVITAFLLTMAALMIVGSKLTDIWGRKRCFMLGLMVYGIGAVIAAAAQGLGLLLLGYSLLEGVGSALMIPPIYILTTVIMTDTRERARAFGLISGAGGIGAATGPLIGGLITTAVSWRASFLFQALIVAIILVLSRAIEDPGIQGEKPQFDLLGGVLSAVGMFLVVIGIMQVQVSVLLMILLMVAGLLTLAWFYLHIRRREQQNKPPLLSTHLFHVKTSNLGLITQNVQWLMLMGTSITVSIYLQIVHGFSAIETGLVFTASTAGLLISSAMAGRLAKRYAQRKLIRTGFVAALLGLILIIAVSIPWPSVWAVIPGLFVMGLGVGVMLTFSVNVVQSAFPEHYQGEISGLSRSVSNLGSSLGTAIAGVIVVASLTANAPYGYSILALIIFGIGGLIASLMLPPEKPSS